MNRNEKQENLDSWDGFLGSNFLQAKDLKGTNQIFVCVGVEYDAENGRPMILLESNEMTYKFSLNVTNCNFLKDTGLRSPKEVIGRKIVFRKSMAYSPTAKKDVETLRIQSIE